MKPVPPMTTIFMAWFSIRVDGDRMDKADRQDFAASSSLSWVLVQKRSKSRYCPLARRARAAWPSKNPSGIKFVDRRLGRMPASRSALVRFVFENHLLDVDRRELTRGSKAIATG